MTIKLTIARAQLGTALDLFIRDKDPLSVHALACGGAEIIEGLAEHTGVPTMATLLLSQQPELDRKTFVMLRNKYWNPIKHFYERDLKTARADEELMSGFSDAKNEDVLLLGWNDYSRVARQLPIEAQVFQVWWYALSEDRMAPDSDPAPWRNMFPGILAADRTEQKRRLRRAVEKYRKNDRLLSDPRTERGPLITSAS